MPNRFEDLLIALVDDGAEFVVAGGVASVLQGVERVTLGLDLSLSFAPRSIDAFLQTMKRFGLTSRAPVAPELLTDPNARRNLVETKHAIVLTFQDLKDPFWHVDVFLREDLTYESLRADSETIDLDGRAVRIQSRQKLLELKLAIDPLRAKDQLDIAELRRLIQESRS